MAIKFRLRSEAHLADPQDLTPSEMLIILYLRLREAELLGGASRDEMAEGTGVAVRSLDRALPVLTKHGFVERYRAPL